MSKRPDLRYERRLWREGVEMVAGVDEAGVGPLAGPVVAAAVIFAPEIFIRGVHDSKQLRADQREMLAEMIRDRALTIGVGISEVEEIDRVNVYHAAIAASRRAIEALRPAPAHALLDGRGIPSMVLAQTPIVGGDRKSFCIAAASIIAKVERDRIMREYDAVYPGYGFARHKGYGTPEHMEAIERLGPSPIHRFSFAPVRQMVQLKFALA